MLRTPLLRSILPVAPIAALALLSLSACSRLQAASPRAEVRVLVATSGMSTSDVERQVTVPLERQLLSIDGLTQLRSRSFEEGAELRLSFAPRLDPFSLPMVVREKLRPAELPGDILPTIQVARGPIIYRYTVDSTHLSSSELRSLHDRLIRPALEQLQGVAEVGRCGGAARRVELIVDPQRLASLGLTLLDVSKAAQATLHVAAGPLIRSNAGNVSISDLEQIQVAERSGIPVRLRDVAMIRSGAAPPDCLAGRDEKSSVLVGQVWLRSSAEAQGTEQLQAAQDAIHARIMELRTTLPPGVELRDFASAPTPPELRKKKLLSRLLQRAEEASRRVVRVRLTLPAEPQLATVQSLAAALREKSRELPEVESALTQASLVQTAPAVVGELELLLALRPRAPLEPLSDFTANLLARLAQLPAAPTDVEVSIFDTLGGPAPKAPRPISLRLSGADLAQLETLATQIRKTLLGHPAVRAIRALGTTRLPQRRIHVDRAKAAQLGVPFQDLVSTLSSVMGQRIAALYEREETVPVILQSAQEKDLPAALEALSLKGSSGALVPLSQLVSIKLEETPAMLLREASQRCVLLRVTSPTLDAEALIKLAREQLRNLQLPAGTSLTFVSELDD